MMLNPAGRVILVSGASRGIGWAVADALYAAGYHLSLGVRDPAALALRTMAWDPERLFICRYLAEDWATHRAWVDDTTERFGRVDGLVNNAGQSSTMTLRAPDQGELDRIWAVNCKAPLSMIHCALPYLERSGSGRIVNIASMSGKRVKNDHVAYAMTKFAVVALTHAARRIAWDKGVRATVVCPSFVETDMTAGNPKLEPALMSRPEDVAALIVTALALPNNAAVAEMLVNCRLEDTL